MAYPRLSDIEVKWRASGSGVRVIVEGETELEDPWFYNTWFGSHAREVSFFPQDGWERVVAAVQTLRLSLGVRRVYGIVDRDFEEAVTYDPFPGDGILRTSNYTLENYLLDVECWLEYVEPHTLRVPKPGWNTLDEARTTIEGLYAECLPLSVYNWTLRRARRRHYTAFEALPDTAKEYKEHPRALQSLGDAPAALCTAQAQMGISDNLVQMYTERLAALEGMPVVELEQVVSGKYVLNLLREQFPLGLSGKQAWNDVLGAYISICPDPPADLAALVDLILRDAGRQSGNARHRAVVSGDPIWLSTAGPN